MSLPFFFVPGRTSRRSVKECGPGLQGRSAIVSLSSVTGLSPESQIVPPSRRTSACRITIAERPVKPGPHSFTLRLEVRPGTKKKGKDIDNLGYSSEQTFAIVVPDGKRTTVALTGDEDGSLPEYEPRIELELESDTLKK